MPATGCSARSSAPTFRLAVTRRKHAASDARVMSEGDTAWLLVSTGLVMLMTPGLALFYGGMVQSKNVLSTFMHSFFALGIVSIQFAVIGYSLAFGQTHGGVIGGFDYVGLSGITETSMHDKVPHLAYVAYQCMFAVITPALI